MATVLLPGLGATQARAPVDAATWPWSAIVRVQTAGISRCSGFLIAPDRVVTAAHCLYARRPRRMLQPGSIHVLTGYRHGAYTAHTLARSYVVGAAYTPEDPGRNSGDDFAVLLLAAPVAPRGLPLAPVRTGQGIKLAGYQQDRAEQLLADQDCRAMGVLPDPAGHPLRQHTCAATSGSSGAPLLARDASGAWVAGGVQVAGELGEAGGLAVPAETVLARIGPQ